MYFLTEDERRLLLRKLLPEARAAGVAEELRGWNWNKPPLSPIYEGRLGVWEVASQLCPSGHDLYLRRVLRLKCGEAGEERGRGAQMHAVVQGVITEAKRIVYEHGSGCLPALEGLTRRLYQSRVGGAEAKYGYVPISGQVEDGRIPIYAVVEKSLSGSPVMVENAELSGSETEKVASSGQGGGGSEPATLDSLTPAPWDAGRRVGSGGYYDGRARQQRRAVAQQGIRPASLQMPGLLQESSVLLLAEFEARRVAAAVEEALAKHRSVSVDSLVASALPVAVGYQLDGSLLGLVPRVSADMLMVGEPMPVVVRFGPRREFHRLVAAGYAMVAESAWECPVNIGCVVYSRVADGRIVVERDLWVIGDELRQQFIEMRDERTRLVEEEIDPGPSAECYSRCHLYGRCHTGV